MPSNDQTRKEVIEAVIRAVCESRDQTLPSLMNVRAFIKALEKEIENL